MQVSESHKSARFHTLIWFSLLVTLAEFKKKKEEKMKKPITKYVSTLYIGMAMVEGLCPFIWTITVSVSI